MPEEKETTLPRLTAKELSVLNTWVLGGAPPFPSEDRDNLLPPIVSYSAIAARAENVFQRRCYQCHSYDTAKGGIKILHHRLLVHVRKVVVPGKPASSELFHLITSNDPDLVMPPPAPDRDPLTAEEIEVIRQWIESGAPAFPKSDD